jgi:glucose-1-phosphate thymidylyltransferase
MKGIVLAGGHGTRLYPLTKVTNKHLLPVARKPMIYYPVEKLVRAGIEHVLIVTGLDHMGDVVNLLGSGREFGCQFTYRVQDEAGGIAQALGLASQFARDDRMCVILGDNVFQDDLAPHVKAFEEQGRGARILLKQVTDPGRFGVAEVQGDRIASIEEKPKQPKSDFAITGIYLFDARVFDIIPTLKPSKRGELEVTDILNHYLREGTLKWSRLDGWWTDAGTFESIDLASRLARDTWETPSAR